MYGFASVLWPALVLVSIDCAEVSDRFWSSYQQNDRCITAAHALLFSARVQYIHRSLIIMIVQPSMLMSVVHTHSVHCAAISDCNDAFQSVVTSTTALQNKLKGMKIES